MTQINERIEELTKTIDTLRAYRAKRDFSKYRESEIIINICELQEELDELKAIKKANRSLF